LSEWATKCRVGSDNKKQKQLRWAKTSAKWSQHGSSSFNSTVVAASDTKK